MPPKESQCNQHAEHLKTQGNEFFQKNEYQLAHRKYTEAIKLDPKNAIYYANRAASSLAMKEYLDAAADAGKATELDPNYAKAWSRLATASHQLSSFPKSIKAWETALKCLPPVEQSSELDKKLRVQFEAGLASAKKARDKPFKQDEYTHVFPAEIVKELPWNRAEAMEAELIAQQKFSSAIVILRAYREFKAAADDLKKFKKTVENGKMRYFGKTGTLDGISNAIMSDHRVFHIDFAEWIDTFNHQVMFEAQVYRAWADGGAKTIKEEAPKRLKREGWEKVRPAISVTVRAWLMSGLLAGVIGKHVTAMEYHSRALEVLEWGERTWQNVPQEQRGVVFSKTFMRGVRRMKLRSMNICIASKEAGVDFTSDDMAEFARDIVAETDANQPGPADEPLDAGFAMTFWSYPKAEALSTLGWHYMQIANKATTAEDAQAAYTQSSEYYFKAAKSYPFDEEQTLEFLKVALEAYWFSPEGKPFKDMMPYLLSIEERLPHVIRIWEHSSNAASRDGQVVQALEFAKRCADALGSGKITPETFVRPKELKSQIKWKGEKFVYV